MFHVDVYPKTPPPPPVAPHQDPGACAVAVLAAAPDAVIVCAADGPVTMFNPAAEALYGVPASSVLGRPFPSLAGGAAAGPGRRTQHRRDDGSVIDVEVSAVPVVVDGAGTMIAYFVRDIAAERAGEQRRSKSMASLEQHAVELSRSNADLEQFAYIASHDLAAPLRAITGMLALLTDEVGDELGAEAGDYISRANAAAARMRLLIDDLMTYSRVGRDERDRLPVDLEMLVGDVASSFGAAGERVVVTTPLPVVEGSALQLRQLLQNLISNGLKFNRSDESRVEVAAHRDGPAWRLTVADNGIGIPPEYRDRVFGVFKRLHTRDAYPGTGIGLAICQRVVERHNGAIWVETGPQGSGTSMCFTLAATDGNGDSYA